MNADARDLGLGLMEARTEELSIVDGPTRPLGIPTVPVIPTIRPYPRVTYPPPVPGRADAVTTLLPAMVRA